jgi:hypothetical protein
VFGLAAAVLASVYRYIVRLSYFYESRADAVHLYWSNGTPDLTDKGGKTMRACARLMRDLSPEEVQFPSALSSLKHVADALLKKPSK